MRNNFFKKSYILLALAILFITILVAVNLVMAQSEKVVYDLAGWFWTDNYGWISLNSENIGLTELAPSKPYKLVVDNNEIYGWGWSSNVGWICFGKTCDPNNICSVAETENEDCNPFNYGTVVPSGGWKIIRDPQTKTISGWAKVLSLNDFGWIHLGQGSSLPNEGGVNCYDCQYDTSTPPNITDCQACFTNTKFDGEILPQDFGGQAATGGSGKVCFDCVSCNKKLSKDEENFIINCQSCDSCRFYGGVFDSQTGGLLGWGWNGNTHPLEPNKIGVDGAGWLQYGALGGESGIVYPWLQTLYGSVFSQNSIRQKSLISGFNATYCIFAKDVFNFRSANCNQNIKNIDIKFPQPSSVDQSYKNALGRIDLFGLTSKIKLSNGKYYNKYGNIIIESMNDQTWREPMIFNNSVYVINGDLTIENGFFIKNALEEIDRGNGLVVINGDLIIKNDFGYDNTDVYGIDLKRLASVAWVIKGDVEINPSVNKVVGAFIVLGRQENCFYSDQTPCSEAVDYPKYAKNGYGIFFSGSSDKPLVVSGLIVAKAFDLERSYSDIKQGSEQIIYDGRLIANPPPGFKGFLEGLPVIRDFEF